ncbi:hypothetical protein FC41_GL000275 [Lactobacillus hominis DSM 23910 = CRBIP 24.179]|nr:hypothetical protein FC41_GL000275 [Lactobacillus hominis DSM 23910 = CRBIP 24.179]
MVGLNYRKKGIEMKKSIKFTVALLSLFALAGCSNVHTSKDGNNLEIGQKSKKRSTKKTKTSKPTARKKQTNSSQSLTDKQQASLDKTMADYGKKRKISYVRYDGKHLLKNSAGRIYPDTFKKDTFILNNKKISIGWAPQGGDQFAYKVLAIYNHDFDQKGKHETYIFCIHDKKPIVLVDTAKEGNKIVLTQSQDRELNQHFDGIMNGTQY